MHLNFNFNNKFLKQISVFVNLIDLMVTAIYLQYTKIIYLIYFSIYHMTQLASNKRNISAEPGFLNDYFNRVIMQTRRIILINCHTAQ